MRRYRSLDDFFNHLKYFLTSLRSSIYMAIIVVVVGTVVIVWKTPATFWQSYLSNALATFVGILIGIPITLWVTSRQEEETESKSKINVLTLLKRELRENYDIIQIWSDSPTNKEDLYILQSDIKCEVWDAFSDGGLIQWIKDPELLNQIANCFFSLKNLKEIADWTNMTMNYVERGASKVPGLWLKVLEKKDSCQKLLGLTIRQVDESLETYVKKPFWQK